MVYFVKARGMGFHLDGVGEIDLFDIEFLSLHGVDFSPFDFFLFTSKRAILSANYSRVDLSSKPSLILGGESRSVLRRYSSNVYFKFDFRCVDHLLESVMSDDNLRGSRIAYFRGSRVIRDVLKALDGYALVSEFVCYKSVELPVQDRHFEKYSVFIFGSPSSYRRFTDLFNWDDTFVAIALGSSTFSCFRDNIRKFNANGNFKDAYELAKKVVL